jgi:hypothetical protein
MPERTTTLTKHRMSCVFAAVFMMLLSAAAHAQAGGRFDLSGPSIDVHVQRGTRSLPIATVPNLLPGDHLLIHADLPSTQSVKLLLVVAFLRGSTNPPPNDWFTHIETWDKKTRSEGVTVTVPNEAQQALIFLAPDTGGGFATLKSAVIGRPGVFVRAAQDLNEASFEQARIERYLQAIRKVPAGSPAELLDHSHKLAATLNLKPNEECFKKPADQQLACLQQTGSQLLLDDGHGQTLAAMITNGDSANLIGAVASTPMANVGGAAAYSAYVGTVIDLVRLMSGLHTAHFQYIPAIAFPDQEALNLRLNVAPSFNSPKSVIVVALPAVHPSVLPPLHLQDPGHVSCLLQPSMVLPLEGAPLVFATSFAHDLVLHLNGATIDGKTDLPMVPDAYDGGLVLSNDSTRKPLPMAAPEARDAATSPLAVPTAKQPEPAATLTAPSAPAVSDTTGEVLITGTLRGLWGFDSFEGVTVPLQRRVGTGWKAVMHGDLIAGKANQLALRADGTACASKIELDAPGAPQKALTWEPAADSHTPAVSRPLEVKLPLEGAAPGGLGLRVHQFGTDTVDKVAIIAYSDRTRLAALHIHAGDNAAMLTGTGLGEVRSVKFGDTEYKPAAEQGGDKELRLQAVIAKGEKARTQAAAGATGIAEAMLADGRTVSVPYSVDIARPSIQLLTTSAHLQAGTGLPLTLGDKNDLPLDARITIALRSASPARFPRGEKIEIALTDGSLHTALAVADGSLVLQDAHTALAFFSPAKSFGTSAFGPLQLRAVAEDGTTGDWLPLGTLVRTPSIASITCTRQPPRAVTPAKPDAPRPDATKPDDTVVSDPVGGPCTLTGRDLFLIDSVSADSSFNAAVPVPLGFAGEALPVPKPADSHTLYLKLRDDPSAIVSIPMNSAAANSPHHSTPVPQPTAAPAP